MATVEDLKAKLRALPRPEPDPIWKQRTKRKLLQAMALAAGHRERMNRWAIFATYDREPINFALWVRAKGREWRPIAVDPDRLQSAVAMIQPNIVVIDPRVPRRDRLEGVVHASCAAETTVATDSDLAACA